MLVGSVADDCTADAAADGAAEADAGLADGDDFMSRRIPRKT